MNVMAPRPISNKTRIETRTSAEVGEQQRPLPDRFPTKQGLKHDLANGKPEKYKTPRPISNKTRIETV